MHIHAEGPAFFAWLPKMFGKRVVVTVHGIDWQREKWQSGLGSKFIHQGEKNAAKYADEVIVLSKGVQDYFKETYGRETHFIPNGVNRPQIREASLITDKFGLKKDSYILFLGRLVPEKGIRYLVEAFKNVKVFFKPRIGLEGKFLQKFFFMNIHKSEDQELVDRFCVQTRATMRKSAHQETAQPVPCQMINCFCMYSDYTPLTLEEWVECDRRRRENDILEKTGENK